VSEFIVNGLSGEEAGDERSGDERAARGRIPVVLLHGLTATRRYVVMGSRALERGGHRVVSYDARGHGRSASGEYSYPALAQDLLAVLDDRRIERAVLAGASMGAHTIVRLALDHGDRVAGVVLITPAYTPEGDHTDLARWDALADGLRDGGVEGFVQAYGDPGVPEAWRETVIKVVRQRLSAHQHPEAVADALRAVPRSRAFEDWAELGELELPAVVVASRDEADPGHPYAVGERYAREIPGAELVSEEPGASPLAWQGGQLSKVIAALAERAS
jgi:pimeloyl-ACP methyl ester carboxylesterase